MHFPYCNSVLLGKDLKINNELNWIKLKSLTARGHEEKKALRRRGLYELKKEEEKEAEQKYIE
jgi:hypothetical protein